MYEAGANGFLNENHPTTFRVTRQSLLRNEQEGIVKSPPKLRLAAWDANIGLMHDPQKLF